MHDSRILLGTINVAGEYLAEEGKSAASAKSENERRKFKIENRNLPLFFLSLYVFMHDQYTPIPKNGRG
jgi:hypothetical protein